MQRVYIGIGSNLGDRVLNCKQSIDGTASFSDVTAVSSYYETEPVGNENQPLFINCAIEIISDITPHQLLAELSRIENRLGRVREKKWGPRTIDLDIIFFGDEIIDDADLKIPHPEAHKRRFVLEPLAEIAPTLVHPVLNATVAELLSRLEDPKNVVKVTSSSTDDPQ